MKKILITGGAGFVGSHLCNAFISLGYEVYTIDDLSNGNEENICESVKFEKLDISTEKLFKKYVNIKFDSVIHCAAQSSNALSFVDIKKDIESNFLSTYNVLELCKMRGISRLIFTSSLSVYGQAMHLPIPESCPPNPKSYYAVNKLAAEQYIKLFSSYTNINFTIFRLFTTYGVGQNLANRDQGLLSIYISYILANEELIVKGSPDRKRDLVSVSDVVDVILKSHDAKVTYGKTYNLGSGKAVTVRRIIDLLVEGLAKSPNEYSIKYEENTPGDPHETLAEMSLLKQDLGWSPKIMPEEGIKQTIEFYKQNI